MAIYARSNRVGIDQAIYRIQNLINDNITWVDTHIYGRIYRNRKNKDSIYIAESYESGKEYTQIFVDDNKGGIVGFYVKNSREVNQNTIIADVEVICTVNIETIYTSSLREDEKALIEMNQLLQKAHNMGLTINEVNTKNDVVFTDFDKENIKFRDMHPFFNFSFSGTLEYKANLCLTS